MSTQSPYPQQPYQFPTPPPQQAQAAPKKPRRWPWVLGMFVAFVFGTAVGNAPDTATPTASSTYTPPAAAAPAYESLPTYAAPAAPTVEAAPVVPSGPAATFSDGTYEVGVDVEPGRYKTTGPDGSGFIDSCYWARNSNDSGEFSAIIANDNISGPGSITVKSGEFVELSGGCVWTKQ